MRSLITIGTVLVLASGILTACAGENQVTRKAPKTESELGFLVLGAKTQEKENYLSNQPAAQIRILSEKHGFYEVRYDNYESIKESFPNATIHKNEFYKTQTAVNDIEQILTHFKNEEYHLAEVTKKQNHSLEVLGEAIDFSSCKRNGLKPVLNIKPLSPNLSRREPLTVGEEIVIDASQSQPHAFTGGDLKLSFVISAPLGSKTQKIYQNKTLNLSLDTMGVYQIMIVAQDVKDVCDVEVAKVLVTGNEPFAPSIASKDPSLGQQKFRARLGIDQAHQISKGEGVIIAVIDSGVNYNHPHLAENIFRNPNESDNGLDNDNNGYEGDLYGWDFANDDPYPFDDNGHGSHVAGLSAGKIFGVAPNATILPIKVTNPAGVSDLGSSLQAIVYALDMGAKVLNLSYGNYRPPVNLERQIIALVEKADAIILAAAGNGDPNTGLGVNTDVIQHMPSGLNSNNLISVAALNENDQLTYYSNYGAQSVQVATYGGEDFDMVNHRPYNGQLYSAYIPNPEGQLFHPAQGTSMSTPIAAGIAALVRSANPDLSAAETADILKHAGPNSSKLEGKIKSGKILTAIDALKMATPTLDLVN